jgi:hypothetical protein
MDIFFLAVTVISLAAAFASVLAVRKLKHADQLRSDARVAALMTAADADVVPPPVRAEAARPRQPKVATDGRWNSVAGEMRWEPEPSGNRDSGFEIRSVREKEQVPNSESRTPTEERFFGTVQREQPASTRFAFAAAFALIVALGGAVLVFTSSNHDKVPVTRAAHASPLELLSLNHSRDANALTINGVVRNPANGSKLEGLTAVVSLIDEHGGLISTKDVPLDYRALGPGEEAPFRISVPDSGSIARYRVSFRAGTDVVPHVDRRTDTKIASAL